MHFSGNERDRFFLNAGADRPFLELSHAAGLDAEDDGRAVIPFDFDGDGDLDLASMSLQKLRLLENRSPPKRFLELQLAATSSERQAIGAIAVVTAGGRSEADYVTASSGFASGVPRILHFGLGTATTADARVRWPSGREELHRGLTAGARHLIVEGSPTVDRIEIPRWPIRFEDVAPDPAFVLPDEMLGLDGAPKRIEAGVPTIVNFWASWCEPCLAEMVELERASKRKDLRVLGVSIDRDPALAAKVVRDLSITYPIVRADDRTVERFFPGEADRIRLPASFVLGPDRRLLRAFFRAVSAKDIDGALSQTRPVGLETGDVVWLMQRSLYELEVGDFDGAIAELEQATALAPNEIPAWVNLSVAYSKKKRWPECEKAARRAIALAPRHAGAHTNLGLALLYQSRAKAAVPAFETALEIEPGHPTAIQGLVASLKALGKKSEADAVLGRYAPR